MKKMIKTLMMAAMALGFATAHADAAPEFTLKDAHGNEHSLSDFEGKIVVLEWVNHGCPFVVKFYSGGHMQALQKEMVDQGVVWLSICSSAPNQQGWMTPEDQAKTITEKGIKATAVLLDESGTVGRAYGARTTPQMVVIDAEGKIRYNGAIDSIRSTNSADIERADNYVRAAVASVKAGEEVAIPRTQPYGCSVKYSRN